MQQQQNKENIVSILDTFTPTGDFVNELERLKHDFESIIVTKRKNINDESLVLCGYIKSLKTMYMNLVGQTVNNDLNFGLNSFYFQISSINREYHFLKAHVVSINNHMYCEYYKIMKRLIYQMRSTRNIFDPKFIQKWMHVIQKYLPPYNDLENTKDYRFQYIQSAHDYDITLLAELIEHYDVMVRKLHDYEKKDGIGLNITNYVKSFSTTIKQVEEMILLNISFMHFFLQFQSKLLDRFIERIQNMNEHLREDINVNSDEIKQVTEETPTPQQNAIKLVISEENVLPVEDEILDEDADEVASVEEDTDEVASVDTGTDEEVEEADDARTDEEVEEAINADDKDADEVASVVDEEEAVDAGTDDVIPTGLPLQEVIKEEEEKDEGVPVGDNVLEEEEGEEDDDESHHHPGLELCNFVSSREIECDNTIMEEEIVETEMFDFDGAQNTDTTSCSSMIIQDTILDENLVVNNKKKKKHGNRKNKKA